MPPPATEHPLSPVSEPLLRPPRPADRHAVLELLRARERSDFGATGVEAHAGDLAQEWSHPDVRLESDARVIEEPGGMIAAYALVVPEGSIGAVHPAREGRGHGRRLLAWIEERERHLHRRGAPHRQALGSGNERGRALLEGAGYRHVRSYSRMARSLRRLPAEPAVAPVGVRLRPLASESDQMAAARAVHALDAVAFASAPGYEPETLEAFYAEHLGGSGFAPELSLCAWRQRALCGFLLVRRRPAAVGLIDVLAVHPREQGRGIGRALMLEAFAAFAAAGLNEARLDVASDNPRARRLYEQLGMRERHRRDVHERAGRDVHERAGRDVHERAGREGC